MNTDEYSDRRRVDALGKMFADAAPRYEMLNRAMSLGADRRWRRVAAGTVPEDARLVLDLCAGTGNMGKEVARTRPDVKVVLADICPEMLENGGCATDPTFMVTLTDVRYLPFRNDTFDAAIVGFGFRNIDELDRVLEETLRSLKPGAVLAVLDCSMPRNPLMRAACRLYLRTVVPLLAWCLVHSQRNAYNYLTMSIEAYARDIDIEARLTDAGFANADSRRFMFGAALLTLAQKPKRS